MDTFFLSVIISMAVLTVYSYYKKKKAKRRKREKLQDQWAKSLNRKHNWSQIKLYHHLRPFNNKLAVDDSTWHDLNMNEVFSAIDRTQSYPGQQLLYDVLKSLVFEESVLQQRHEAISVFSQDSELRVDLQMELQKLAEYPFWRLPNILFKPLPKVPKWYKLFFLIPVIGLAFIVLGFLNPIYFLALAVVPVVNMVIEYFIGGEVSEYSVPLGALGAFIKTAERIQKSLNSQSKEFADTNLLIKQEVQALRRLKKRVGKFMPRGPQDDLAAIVRDYLNLFFLMNISMFTLSVESIAKHRDTLTSLYKKVGLVDALISVASFKEGAQKTCKPVFLKTIEGITIEGAIHPLLEHPISNNIKLGDKGLLITGSNMSGKSTYLKTIGVNLILAQSFNFCCAEKADITFCKVVSSMRREDDITEGKSYYLGEVERVKVLLDKSREKLSSVFLLDEIFRGTNTLERVSASMHVLKWLNASGKYVVASTHDLELVELLKEEFEFYHFTEEVTGDKLKFDYKLKEGHASTRNAIKLLDIWNYPSEVVQGALKTSEELERDGFHKL